MGFPWEGENVVSVGLTSSPLIEEIPDVTKQAIVNALLGGYDAIEGIKYTKMHSMRKNILHLYNTAVTKSPYGLPETEIKKRHPIEASDALQRQAVGTEHGVDPWNVYFNYAFIGRPEGEICVKWWLQKNYGYDTTRPKPTSGPFAGHIRLGTNNKLYWTGQYKFALTYDNAVYVASAQFAKLGYSRPNDDTESYTTYWQQLTTIPNEYLYQFKWYDITKQNMYWWVYDPRTQAYPWLVTYNLLINTPSFFPIIPIRDNWVYPADGSPMRNFTKSALKKLGLPLKDVEQSVKDLDTDGTIANAYVTFAVDIRSEVPEVREYLYTFFEDLYNDAIQLGQTDPEPPDRLSLDKWKTQRFGLRIRENYFNYYFYYVSLQAEWLSETIGPVGTVTSVITINPVRVEFVRDGDQEDGYVGTTVYRYNQSLITYKKQVYPGSVRAYKVYGIAHFSDIFGKVSEEVTLNSPLTSFIMLPLNKQTFAKMTGKQRDVIAYSSMRLVINGYQVTHLKFYQTSSFGMFIKFVGAALTMYFMGTDGGKFSELAVAIAEYLAVDTVIVNVVLQIAIAFGIGAAGAGISKLLGGEAAMIFAALAMAYGLSGSFGSSIPGLPNADLALALSSAVTKGVQDELAKAFKDLAVEAAEFYKTAEEQMTELKKAKDLLSDKANSINPLFLIAAKVIINTNESPSDFINRTIHNPNPGLTCLSAIQNYVSGQLKLPSPPVAYA